MSGKSVEQQKREVRQTAGNARQPDGQPAGHPAGQAHNPLRSSPAGESCCDPLGNFSEQIGAYFG